MKDIDGEYDACVNEAKQIEKSVLVSSTHRQRPLVTGVYSRWGAEMPACLEPHLYNLLF